MAVAMAAAAMLACSDDNGPNDGGGGGVTSGAITVGNLFFQSAHNQTRNPARDTVLVGQVVTWTWTATGATPHSVTSVSDPGFQGSDQLSGDNTTFTHTFDTPGTYQYICSVHPTTMSGIIVVQ